MFKSKKPEIESLYPSIPTKNNLLDPEKIKENAKAQEDEWIWVTGYKGTHADMRCWDFQYELGKTFCMAEDAKIAECESGFHLCLKLEDVFRYYDIGAGHRFFEVKALVRAGDVKKYGTSVSNGRFGSFLPGFINNKLVARSIKFVRELTVDEILKYTDTTDWTDDHKKMALVDGVESVRHMIQRDELVKLGYSETFAMYMVENYKFKIAKAFGSQPDLSMDMKVWAIFNGKGE